VKEVHGVGERILNQHALGIPGDQLRNCGAVIVGEENGRSASQLKRTRSGMNRNRPPELLEQRGSRGQNGLGDLLKHRMAGNELADACFEGLI
jgi:hypothetical protein